MSLKVLQSRRRLKLGPALGSLVNLRPAFLKLQWGTDRTRINLVSPCMIYGTIPLQYSISMCILCNSHTLYARYSAYSGEVQNTPRLSSVSLLRSSPQSYLGGLHPSSIFSLPLLLLPSYYHLNPTIRSFIFSFPGGTVTANPSQRGPAIPGRPQTPTRHLILNASSILTFSLFNCFLSLLHIVF